MTATAWAIAGGALVVVGLGIAVAVLGVQLGRARAGQANTAAELASARANAQERLEARDQAVAQLEDERARAGKQMADLRARAAECAELAARNMPPAVLRERLRDLLEGDGKT